MGSYGRRAQTDSTHSFRNLWNVHSLTAQLPLHVHSCLWIVQYELIAVTVAHYYKPCRSIVLGKFNPLRKADVAGGGGRSDSAGICTYKHTIYIYYINSSVSVARALGSRKPDINALHKFKNHLDGKLFI